MVCGWLRYLLFLSYSHWFVAGPVLGFYGGLLVTDSSTRLGVLMEAVTGGLVG